MSSTKLQDTKTRLEQYKQALSFYLSETPYRILFVENTLYDFSSDFSFYIHNGRLEYLTFSGNSYDPSLGKGYGEAQIIRYAINHSLFLKSASVIIKITGRIKVKNVVDLCSSVNISNKKNVMIACNIRPSKKIGTSTFFICKEEFLTRYFLPYMHEINEANHSWFEHILYESIIQCKKEKKTNLIFPKPIKIEGIAGTTSRPYPKTKWTDYILSCFAAFLHNYFGYIKF